MKKALLILITLAAAFYIPAAQAEPNLSIGLTPEPEYQQVWAYETYLVNITIVDLNISDVDLSTFTGVPDGINYRIKIQWRGKGGYDFGEATTGYNYNLDEAEYTFNGSLSDTSILFNLTLEKDAFEYGMKPFESVDIIIDTNAILVMDDASTGPVITSRKTTYRLVDETKQNYLEGKYLEMSWEINTVLNASGLDSLNRAKYQEILDDMNNSLAIGNLVQALDIWDDYDEDERTDLINGIINANNRDQEALDELRGIESSYNTLEQEYNILQTEYEQLEKTYSTLANTYAKVNKELETVQGNLSTAITAVFLTAIAFFFLGRRVALREVIRDA